MPRIDPPENPPKVLGATLIADMPPENAGSVIGPYKLLQQIGQGGFRRDRARKKLSQGKSARNRRRWHLAHQAFAARYSKL